MKVDWLITNGLVFDGTLSEPYEADIGIVSERISFIKRNIRGYKSKNLIKSDKVIDVKGLSVAPGFIDTHSHSEFTLLADPRAEGKVCQGITTEINGNCGFSAAPLQGDAFTQREEDLKELCIRERWSTFNQYFHILQKRGIPVNFITLTGHGNIRASVKGYSDEEPTKSDLKKMCNLLRKSINKGAIGLSTGLIYPPGMYSKTEELIELCKVISQTYIPPLHLSDNSKFPLSKRGLKKAVGGDGIYTTHMRSEGDKLIESIEETIRIGTKTGIRVHISHIKTSGKENWHKIIRTLSIMEESKKEGVSLTCDIYPYTASSTDLDTILPSWVYVGGKEGELKRLKNKRLREKIRKQLLGNHSSKDYWKKIYISSVSSEKNKWMEGKRLYDIACKKGKDLLDIFFDILIEERLMVSAIFKSTCEGNLKKFLSLPHCMVGTDSSARCFSGTTCRGKPHPRGFGSFPRFLGNYVRNENLMSMSEGIHKITMLPAQTFRIHKRGVIESGAYADIVIFNHEIIIDRATFKDPFLKPEGIYYVFVNGVPAIWEGRLTGSKSGKILRHGR